MSERDYLSAAQIHRDHPKTRKRNAEHFSSIHFQMIHISCARGHRTANGDRGEKLEQLKKKTSQIKYTEQYWRHRACHYVVRSNFSSIRAINYSNWMPSHFIPLSALGPLRFWLLWLACRRNMPLIGNGPSSISCRFHAAHENCKDRYKVPPFCVVVPLNVSDNKCVS